MMQITGLSKSVLLMVQRTTFQRWSEGALIIDYKSMLDSVGSRDLTASTNPGHRLDITALVTKGSSLDNIYLFVI